MLPVSWTPEDWGLRTEAVPRSEAHWAQPAVLLPSVHFTHTAARVIFLEQCFSKCGFQNICIGIIRFLLRICSMARPQTGPIHSENLGECPENWHFYQLLSMHSSLRTIFQNLDGSVVLKDFRKFSIVCKTNSDWWKWPSRSLSVGRATQAFWPPFPLPCGLHCSATLKNCLFRERTLIMTLWVCGSFWQEVLLSLFS